MVSPLSSRIINIQCKANLRDGLEIVSDPNTAYPDRRRLKRSGGCLTEHDVLLDQTLHPLESKIQNPEGDTYQTKHPKIDKSELNLIASCILQEIKNGNGTVEHLQIPVTEHANMSYVSLHIVSDKNPYIDEKASRAGPEYLSVEMLTCLELLRTSKSFYTDDNLFVGEVLSTGNMSSVTASSSCSRSASRSPSVSDDNRSDDLSVSGISNGKYSNSKDIDQKSLFHNQNIPQLEILTLDDAVRHSQPSARLLIQAKNPFTILYANAAFSDFTGLSSESMIGKNIDKFLPADAILDILTERLKKQERVIFDPSGGTIQDGCHGNSYIECNINILSISPPMYLMVVFSKGSEQIEDVNQAYEVDLFSDTDLVSVAGDESTSDTEVEAFSLVG